MRKYEYEIGDSVYLRTDPSQHERLVVGILITPDGIRYTLALETLESSHYGFEISKEKDNMKLM